MKTHFESLKVDSAQKFKLPSEPATNVLFRAMARDTILVADTVVAVLAYLHL